ncbi:MULTISPECIES: hypothetical protein [Bradyrhizobium]|uniref:hypothetical protein n=1 Tax=Bradyrhizobium elkanii TaxID=29448 RepID=UPI00114D1432|nr:hypothetical protein [Bradyrhizobium elkanii]MCP1909245.1 hypothetical protein [Bradyrhizobium elkanii]
MDSKATYEPGRQTDALERFEQFKPKLAQPEGLGLLARSVRLHGSAALPNVDYGDELIDAGHEAGHHASGECRRPIVCLTFELASANS